MDCNTFENKLMDYLEGNAPPKLKEEMDLHLQQCPSCQKSKQEMELLLEVMDGSLEFVPNEELNHSFAKMLEDEKLKTSNPPQKKGVVINLRQAMQIAAAIIILIGGFAIGWKLQSSGNNGEVASADINSLKNEVSEMKELVMYTMLKQDSPSKRIKAVSYANEVHEPDTRFINALVNTLNKDDNDNVRLAAAKALAKFANNDVVKNALISSLNIQEDPSVQIELINILVEIEEKQAIGPMKELLENEHTIDLVKDHAKLGIDMLL